MANLFKIFTNQKTSEWQSASDLSTDKTFPRGNYSTIFKKLQELQPEMPEYIQMRRNENGTDTLCLHRDARQKFLERMGYIEYPPKTSEWQSALDLSLDENIPSNDSRKMNRLLEKFQSEMPDFIQMRKPKTTIPVLCLNSKGLEMFMEKAGLIKYPPKTSEWQSAFDLATDKTFPSSSFSVITKKLKELQSEMPDFIQIRKPQNSQASICLHKNAREVFMEKSGMITYSPKTNRWKNAEDLSKDETFPSDDIGLIAKKLKELQSEMPDFIQIRKSKSGYKSLCLNKEGRREFIKRAGFVYYPPKTSEWQSASELAKDATFPMTTRTSISSRLEELQHKMPDFIQMRRLMFGNPRLCLHRDGRKEFLERTGMRSLYKTTEWLSAVDLAKENNLNYRSVSAKLTELQSEMPNYIEMRKPKHGTASLCLHRDGLAEFLNKSGLAHCQPKTEKWKSASEIAKTTHISHYVIAQKLIELQPKMPEFIQMRTTTQNGTNSLCLHQDGYKKFLKFIQHDKTKSIKQATKLVSALTDLMQTKKTVKTVPEDSHDM